MSETAATETTEIAIPPARRRSPNRTTRAADKADATTTPDYSAAADASVLNGTRTTETRTTGQAPARPARKPSTAPAALKAAAGRRAGNPGPVAVIPPQVSQHHPGPGPSTMRPTAG